MDNKNIYTREFTEEEIKHIRAAIRVSQEDIEQWRKDTEPTYERMHQKINVFCNCKRIR